MAMLHFLNVKEGDCSIIQHASGHISVIDVCNAKKVTYTENDISASRIERIVNSLLSYEEANQKKYPVNPIVYLHSLGIQSVFRFILTHPDMDHMDGMKDFFETFKPLNFWDIDNCEDKSFDETSPYNEDDWLLYKELRDGGGRSQPKRITNYSGDRGKYWNADEAGEGGGDGLYILAPSKELVQEASEKNDYNDCSYVLLYNARGGKIVFGGDSHDKTWEYILSNHEKVVRDIDVLIAPHHGRKSGRSYEFLDVLKPKLTFFGNARAEHLAYDAWNRRDLMFITNNQAGSMLVDVGTTPMILYVTREKYAKQFNPHTSFNSNLQAYPCGYIA